MPGAGAGAGAGPDDGGGGTQFAQENWQQIRKAFDGLKKKRKIDSEESRNVVSEMDDDLLTREGRLDRIENELDEIDKLKDLIKALLDRSRNRSRNKAGEGDKNARRIWIY